MDEGAQRRGRGMRETPPDGLEAVGGGPEPSPWKHRCVRATHRRYGRHGPVLTLVPLVPGSPGSPVSPWKNRQDTMTHNDGRPPQAQPLAPAPLRAKLTFCPGGPCGPSGPCIPGNPMTPCNPGRPLSPCGGGGSH